MAQTSTISSYRALTHTGHRKMRSIHLSTGRLSQKQLNYFLKNPEALDNLTSADQCKISQGIQDGIPMASVLFGAMEKRVKKQMREREQLKENAPKDFWGTYDLAMVKRVKENGGYAGEKNLVVATQKAMADRARHDTDYAVQQEVNKPENASKSPDKSNRFKGKSYVSFSSQFLTELAIFLDDKPRSANAYTIFFIIANNMGFGEYKSKLLAPDIVKQTGIAKQNVHSALKILQEAGAIHLHKNGRYNEILINPYHVYRGLSKFQHSIQGKYNAAVKAENKDKQKTLAFGG